MAILRAVFFDAAGTLFDTRQPVGQTYARLAREFGLEVSDAVVTAGFRRAFGNSPELAFGTGGHSKAELRNFERAWWKAVVARTFEGLGVFPRFDDFFETLFAFFANPTNWQLKPEATAALHRLKEKGLGLGVISNFDSRLYRILETLELKPLFDSITISSEAGFAKPRREVFEMALAKHRLQPAEAMHVGDSVRLDFEAAAAVGMSAVLVDPGLDGPVSIEDRRARICSLAYLKEVTQVLHSA
jgi:putative hydrolase of the HAD superfamily